jgi:hypothetical protein
MKPKERASWRRPFSLRLGSPVHALAVLVKNPDRVDDDKLRALFDHKTTAFEAALANVLNTDAENSVVDLTDAEVAYCAGWALLAELRHGSDPVQLRQAIQEQINALRSMDEDGGPVSG